MILRTVHHGAEARAAAPRQRPCAASSKQVRLGRCPRRRGPSHDLSLSHRPPLAKRMRQRLRCWQRPSRTAEEHELGASLAHRRGAAGRGTRQATRAERGGGGAATLETEPRPRRAGAATRVCTATPCATESRTRGALGWTSRRSRGTKTPAGGPKAGTTCAATRGVEPSKPPTRLGRMIHG